MIYLFCPKCGFAIEAIADTEAANPIRQKRIHYLITRDQVCPNCLNTIGHCEQVTLDENCVPQLKVVVDDAQKKPFSEYLRSKGYVYGTDYALAEFRKG